MSFIEPMHRNKPNITYLLFLTYSHWLSVLSLAEHPSEQFMYVLFWGGASIMSLAAIYFYGNDFVNKPKLAQAKFKTE